MRLLWWCHQNNRLRRWRSVHKNNRRLTTSNHLSWWWTVYENHRRLTIYRSLLLHLLWMHRLRRQRLRVRLVVRVLRVLM